VQPRVPDVGGLPSFLLSPCELDVSSFHLAPRGRHAGLDDLQTRSSLRDELSRRTQASSRSGFDSEMNT